MPDVLFYHLENQPLERVIPILLEKTLERGWRAVVEVGSPERAGVLDAALWTYRDDSFLAHGLAGGEDDAAQPVLITTGPEAPGTATAADVRFFTDQRRTAIGRGLHAHRSHLFSGHDPDAVTEARAAWRALRERATS